MKPLCLTLLCMTIAGSGCKTGESASTVASVIWQDGGTTFLFWKRGDAIFRGRCPGQETTIAACDQDVTNRAWSSFARFFQQELQTFEQDTQLALKLVREKMDFYRDQGDDNSTKATMSSLTLREKVYQRQLALLDQDRATLKNLIKLLEQEKAELVASDRGDHGDKVSFLSYIASMFFDDQQTVRAYYQGGCGLDATHLKCWYENLNPRNLIKADKVISFTTQKYFVSNYKRIYVCAVLIDRAVHCWSDDVPDAIIIDDFAGAHEVAMDAFAVCAAYPNRVRCGNWNANGYKFAVEHELVNPSNLAVSIRGLACAVTDEGVACFSTRGSSRPKIIAGAINFRVGDTFCFRMTDNSVQCSPNTENLDTVVEPTDRLSQFDVGHSNYTCGVIEGEVSCGRGTPQTWRNIPGDQLPNTPPTAISVAKRGKVCVTYTDQVFCTRSGKLQRVRNFNL